MDNPRPLDMSKEIENLCLTPSSRNKQEPWETKHFHQVLPFLYLVRNFSYDCRYKKEAVPKANERPVHGMKSNKNFIVTNAIENILSNAKKTEEPTDYLKKKDFGKTPDYLNRIKDNIQSEYKMIQNLHMQYNDEK